MLLGKRAASSWGRRGYAAWYRAIASESNRSGAGADKRGTYPKILNI